MCTFCCEYGPLNSRCYRLIAKEVFIVAIVLGERTGEVTTTRAYVRMTNRDLKTRLLGFQAICFSACVGLAALIPRGTLRRNGNDHLI